MFKQNFENTADSSLSLLEASLGPNRSPQSHRLLSVGVLDQHGAKYRDMRLNALRCWLVSSLHPGVSQWSSVFLNGAFVRTGMDHMSGITEVGFLLTIC